MGDKIHPTHFQVPEMPWKNQEKKELATLLERIQKLEALTQSLFMTLDFYSLTFKCPKCRTYHSADHKCFNCGFDHTAQN